MDFEKIKLETLVSVVLLLDSQNLESLTKYLIELQEFLDRHYTDYEILTIDQGNNKIPDHDQEILLRQIPSIRWLKLAYPIPADDAMTAGIENAIGDYILIMTPLVDPIAIIDDMVKVCMAGDDIIIGVANARSSLGYFIIRPFMSWLLKSIGYALPRNATSLRCLSRRVVNSVLKTGLMHHQFFVRLGNSGFPSQIFEYQFLDKRKVRKKKLFSGIQNTLILMVFNSTKPLRWMSILGVIGSFFSFIFACYSILINFFKERVVEGWTTMVFFTSFLFMILFIILAFIGEYLARLLGESSKQKKYFVASEQHSSVMLEEQRYNVITNHGINND